MTTKGYTVLGWLAYQVLSRFVHAQIDRNRSRSARSRRSPP
jgi:hypothetical protein